MPTRILPKQARSPHDLLHSEVDAKSEFEPQSRSQVASGLTTQYQRCNDTNLSIFLNELKNSRQIVFHMERERETNSILSRGKFDAPTGIKLVLSLCGPWAMRKLRSQNIVRTIGYSLTLKLSWPMVTKFQAIIV